MDSRTMGSLKTASRRSRSEFRGVSSISGFTLLEMLVVLVIVGILVAIAAPGLLGFQVRQSLSTAQNQIYQIIRHAQHDAKIHHMNWQASFQNINGRAYMATHPVTLPPTDAQWNALPENVQIDVDETTLREDDGFYEVQFNARGHVNGQLGRVTVRATGESRLRRCVFVSTLIGGLREAKENPTPQNGRFCY